MQIIQGIRDKGAAVAIIIIALCLVGFILMDAKTGTNRSMFGGSANTIGKIDGTSVSLTDFNKRVAQESTKQAQQSGQQPAGAELLRIREQVWNQIVAEHVFYAETEKLGITLTSKEISSLLLSNELSNPFMQERGMQDSTGKLNINQATEAIATIKKSKGEQREMIDYRYIEPLKLSTAASKYGGMIGVSAYYPAWMKEKDAADAKSFANISYVGIAYNEISDSAAKVTDEDINKYVAKKKSLFKQEEGRTISYINFSQLPSGADSMKTMQMLNDLKTSFATDTNSAAFTATNSSAIDFKDEFLPLSKITASAKDTIVRQPIGTVYGPYADGPNFAMAKVLGEKQLPDSVKARHILIPLNDQKGQPLRSDSAAKQLADSILTAVKGGADFAALALKYSSDGSAAKGGDLGTFGYGTMVPEFNEFSFTKPAGEKGVVKTQFGYHVIDVINQSNFQPAYKIAYMARPVLASDETINSSSLEATKAAANRTSKDLTDYAAKNGLKIIQLPITIKENDFAVGNMQDARSLVRWVFDAKKGNVSEPIGIGNDFIVATVTRIYEEGTQDAATARPNAEAAVRNQKKAELILAKIGKSPTVEAAAAAYNKPVLSAGADSTITMSGRIINGIGSEPKMIGASFNKENLTKASTPIVGANGVYVLKVNSIQQKAEGAPEEKAAQNTARFAAIRQQSNNWFEALRKRADVKDKRSKFF